MSNQPGTPKAAIVSIGDMLDNCAKVKPGHEVVILAEIEGLYGGDSFVDQEAIAWIQTAVQMRGANASVLWIDEPVKPHAWRFPPVVKGAISACDIMINHSFNLVTEEMTEFREYIESYLDLKISKSLQNNPRDVIDKEMRSDKLLTRIEKTLGTEKYGHHRS